MISLPPFFLLIPYGLIVLAMVFFAVVDVVSLARYGARNWVGLLTSFVYIAGASLIMFLTWQALSNVSWLTPQPLFALPAVSF